MCQFGCAALGVLPWAEISLCGLDLFIPYLQSFWEGVCFPTECLYFRCLKKEKVRT